MAEIVHHQQGEAPDDVRCPLGDVEGIVRIIREALP